MFGKFSRREGCHSYRSVMVEKGSQPIKASLGFISKTNIPIPLQKAAIPKIRINGSWTSISWLYRKKRGKGEERDREGQGYYTCLVEYLLQLKREAFTYTVFPFSSNRWEKGNQFQIPIRYPLTDFFFFLLILLCRTPKALGQCLFPGSRWARSNHQEPKSQTSNTPSGSATPSKLCS